MLDSQKYNIKKNKTKPLTKNKRSIYMKFALKKVVFFVFLCKLIVGSVQ